MIQELIKKLAKYDLFLVKGESQGVWYVEVDAIVNNNVQGVHVATYRYETNTIRFTKNKGILSVQQQDYLEQIRHQAV